MPDGRTLVVGRIVIDGKDRRLEPLSGHGTQTLGYQKNVAALIEAARAYSMFPSARTLKNLKQAAHEVAREGS